MFIGALVAAAHVLGFLTSVHALWNTRTTQGAIAWVISLNTFPYVALPAYWIFGRAKFHGYVDARRVGDLEIHAVSAEAGSYIDPYIVELEETVGGIRALERLASMRMTGRNEVRLLIDGEETFDAIFRGIDSAENYILVQFFIVKDDQLGTELKDRLIARAKEGVRVFFLYDEVGSHKLPSSYTDELRAAGAEVSEFNTRRGRRNRFQLNFRNHRKIVVIDGRVAYVGGHNVGDEYMGRDPKVGPWRDTHVELIGPAVMGAQVSFFEDWHWATDGLPGLNWVPQGSPGGNLPVLVVPSGPADEVETAHLFFTGAINLARERVWIASPYFVPDEAVVAALQLAALRGVDVRILIPERPDHYMVYLSAFSYIQQTEPYGVKFYRYQPGFLHQKALLVDGNSAAVGTANLDNRSFRLNFEVTVFVADTTFASEVEQMFEADFARSRVATAAELEQKSFWFKLAVKFARLLDPIN
jgi:cardiolipin synthase